jgi:RimJ/RimL family protein N-acetyltransferase
MELLTERLLIRELAVSDLSEFERTLNDGQRSCMGGAGGFLNWLIGQYATMDIVNGLICFGVFDKATGKLLGTAGAGKHDDLHEPEIFYMLLPENRGKGYATEAVKAITSWVFDNYDIPYLIGTVGIDNIKSQRVLERCNYQFIDNRTLLVHAEDKKYEFKYYRYYPSVR